MWARIVENNWFVREIIEVQIGMVRVYLINLNQKVRPL